jgi:hypothetical protein
MKSGVLRAFGEFDANGDAVITAKECAAASADGVTLTARLPSSSTPSQPSTLTSKSPAPSTGSAIATSVKAAAPAPNSEVTDGSSSPIPTTLPQSYVNYANGVFQRYDSNKDGVLSADECAKVAKNPISADANSDQRITVEELAWWYVKKR